MLQLRDGQLLPPILILVVFASISCERPSGSPNGTAATTPQAPPEPSPAPPPSYAPFQVSAPAAVPLDRALEALTQLVGEFIPGGDGSFGDWRFSAGETAFQQVARHGDNAVPHLLKCMGNVAPSRVLVAASRVPVGVLCGLALQRTVMYEPVTADGELDPDWPGYVRPNDSVERLLDASEAWEPVVARHLYTLP